MLAQFACGLWKKCKITLAPSKKESLLPWNYLPKRVLGQIVVFPTVDGLAGQLSLPFRGNQKHPLDLKPAEHLLLDASL